MLSMDFTFVWTLINLVVLFLFLRKFLFGRVTKFMDARAEKIAAEIEQGMRDKTEGERYHREQKALLQDATAEQMRILESARRRASEQYAETLATAREEAGRLIAAATAENEREREKLAAQLKDEVVSLALAAAGKVMEANLDTGKNRELVKRFLDDEGAA